MGVVGRQEAAGHREAAAGEEEAVAEDEGAVVPGSIRLVSKTLSK